MWTYIRYVVYEVCIVIEKSGKIIRRRSRAVLDEMLIRWDDGENECGPDHEDCVYNRAYPNAVVRLPELGGHAYI